MKKTFDELVNLLERYDGWDIDEVRKVTYPKFGDTYFYEFFLMDDTKYL